MITEIVEFAFFFLLGIAMGSFLTVVAERFDSVDSFWVGRSKCNSCKKILRWWELLPLLGFLLVRGKCIRCSKSIPRLYPVFELITGLSFLSLRLAAPTPMNYWVLTLDLIVVSILLALCFYDWTHQEFPAVLLFTALGAVIITVIVKSTGSYSNAFVSLRDPLFFWLSSPQEASLSFLKGGIIGAGLLGLLAFPSKGKWMGYGDVILAGVLGLWLGYPFIILSIILAFYAGALVALWQLAKKTVRSDHRIAFGPFLIITAIVTQVWGLPLFNAIIKLWRVL